MKNFDFLRLLYPMRCSGCNKIIPIYLSDCPECGAPIKIEGEACKNCGLPLDKCCCDGSVTDFDFASVYYYDGIARDKILAFKFRSDFSYTDRFCVEMYIRFKTVFPLVAPDLITFVPMSEYSLKQRGFNQAQVLADGFAKCFSVPCVELLKKVKETMNQHDLTARFRKTNLIGSIEKITDADVSDKVIVLVDDIKTTGSTLSVCKDVLIKNGAKEVYLLTLAVTNDKEF